ncbi:MAG: response regulator, partial [Oscillospiraceae bacterium]
MYRISVADDNALHLQEIKRQLQNILQDKIQSVCEFSGLEELMGYIAKQGFPFDIIVTDIDFGEDGVTGIKLAEEIHKISPACRIIFCT